MTVVIGMVATTIVTALLATALLKLTAREPRPAGGRRRIKKAERLVQEHQAFQHRLHRLALASAQVDPFAQVVLDELANHTTHTHEIEAA